MDENEYSDEDFEVEPTYPDPIYQNAQWLVDKNGMDTLDRKYEIRARRLAERDWIYHVVFSKECSNPNLFVEAFYKAREVHGIGDTHRTESIRVPLFTMLDPKIGVPKDAILDNGAIVVRLGEIDDDAIEEATKRLPHVEIEIDSESAACIAENLRGD